MLCARPKLINCICVLASIFVEHIVILLELPAISLVENCFSHQIKGGRHRRRRWRPVRHRRIYRTYTSTFPNPALDRAVESKSLMIQGPGKRPPLGATMIAIFTIGGTCSVTGRDLARSEPRQTDSSAFVRTKRTHGDRPPGIAVSDARCRNYPRTVASEELGLTVSTVNLWVSLPQAISRSAQAETRSAPS